MRTTESSNKMFNLLLFAGLTLLAIECEATTASSLNGWFKFKHHNNYELNQILQTVVSKCPQIATVYELSERTVLGWPLTIIEFSNKPGEHQLREFIILDFVQA